MKKALSTLIGNTLREELDGIDSWLGVLTSTESVLRAVDKKFNQGANYTKVRGELFQKWIDTNHPGALILHVKISSGSRKYLAVDGEVAV